MKHLEINDNIIDIDDIIRLCKFVTNDGAEYKIRILFRYQNKYEQYISFNCKDDMDKAYDTIKQSLIK